MSKVILSKTDLVPCQEDPDQLFDAVNFVSSVVYLENIELSIEQCFDLIKHGVEPKKPLYLKKTMKSLQK